MNFNKTSPRNRSQSEPNIQRCFKNFGKNSYYRSNTSTRLYDCYRYSSFDRLFNSRYNDRYNDRLFNSRYNDRYNDRLYNSRLYDNNRLYSSNRYNRDRYNDCITVSTLAVHEERPCFNGRITASMIIVGVAGELNDICDNYNHSDKIGLEEDHPYEIRALSLDLVKEFPNAKTHNKLSRFITQEMEEKAKAHSTNYSFGYDYVYDYCFTKKKFDACSERLDYLCEIVVPRAGFDDYKNIDATTTTEKTKFEDKDIIATGVRGVREELGIDLNTIIGKKIMSPLYQKNFRTHHSPKLPYNFEIGSGGKTTECFVIGADGEDLASCQLLTADDFEQIYYRRLEKLTFDACFY